MTEIRRLKFGIRDLLWLMLTVGLAIGWYTDRVANHYAYNARQFIRAIDAKQRAERALDQCRMELEQCQSRSEPAAKD